MDTELLSESNGAPMTRPAVRVDSAEGSVSHPLRTVAGMDTESPRRPNGAAAVDAPAGCDGLVPGVAGRSSPEIVFVGSCDALGRVTGLVNALLAELSALSLDGVGRGVLRSLVAVLGRVRAGADAAEARAVTALNGLDDGGVDAVEVLRRNAGSSQREARRRRRRADALARMPNVADALAAGDISAEHADALARAAEATSAEAVDDDADLLAQVAGVPADRAGRHLQTWTQRHQDPADLHEQHLRQRRRRRLHFGDGDDGMLTAHAAFDRVQGAQFRSLINGIADRIWRAEGGRDNPNSRSAEQRRLDALAIAVGLDPAPANPAPADREDATAANPGRRDRGGRTESPRQQNGRTASPRQQNGRTASRSQDGPGDGEDATAAESERDDRRRRTASPRQQNGRTESPRQQNGRTESPRQQNGPGDGEDATTDSGRRDRAGRTESPRQQNGRMASPPQQNGSGDGEDATTDSGRDDRGRRTMTPRQQNGRTESPRQQNGRTVTPRQQNQRTVSPRHQIVIVASADLISGRDPHGRCEIPGVGAIPQSELERLACDAELFGVLFSGVGEPLWHGRGERTATDAQRRALLARDGVCVLCADEPALCESHHIVPWAKPREGPTDIDNLALLCGTCHRRLHNHKRVLTRSADGTWGTAPDPRHTNQPNRTAGVSNTNRHKSDSSADRHKSDSNTNPHKPHSGADRHKSPGRPVACHATMPSMSRNVASWCPPPRRSDVPVQLATPTSTQPGAL